MAMPDIKACTRERLMIYWQQHHLIPSGSQRHRVGNTDDRQVLESMSAALRGKVFGDKGYIVPDLF